MVKIKLYQTSYQFKNRLANHLRILKFSFLPEDKLINTNTKLMVSNQQIFNNTTSISDEHAWKSHTGLIKEANPKALNRNRFSFWIIIIRFQTKLTEVSIWSQFGSKAGPFSAHIIHIALKMDFMIVLKNFKYEKFNFIYVIYNYPRDSNLSFGCALHLNENLKKNGIAYMNDSDYENPIRSDKFEESDRKNLLFSVEGCNLR
ncbi:hypothetical protein Glove_350g76 [Diversispora epigaea]|uniref:Uncharacterized protein n=1 Tax=Diversispora epigaea TaxID=1348612 RepID=A0A397HD24_9GLOM|nr:hypothetical protein Glove_350g76 [Diversispora epigaea]